MQNQKYVIVRSGTGAGVHAGYLVSQSDSTVTLRDARRLWQWAVARQTAGVLATLSEVATYGIDPHSPNSKIGVPVREIVVLGVCEILTAEPAAQASIEAAKL